MTGHGCPECGAERGGESGAERGADGRPGCACAEGAAAALHAERSAEAAASEEFEPLRIRPYVVLPNGEHAPNESVDARPAENDAESDAEGTMRLGVVAPGTVGAGGSGPAEVGGVPAMGSAESGASPYGMAEGGSNGDGGAGVLPYPAHRASGPTHPAGGRARGRRRFVVLTVGAATAVAIATAAFASTLFADDATPKQALPDAVDTGVPYSGDDATAPTPSATASHSRKAVPRRSASASPSASLAPSASTSASKSASPGPSKSALVPPSAPASPHSSRGTEGKPLAPPAGQTLRRGDRGPEVLELQERLSQLGLYTGSVDGGFGSRTERAVRDFQSYVGVTGDPAGVYGPQTRQALEAMTDHP